MKNFKKRTIALVLASVVTVAGSFASENFKNSVMSLSFEPAGNSVNMVLETKKTFGSSLKPIKKDANTYILMLPEVESKASTPDLAQVSDKIESVNVRTMPYTSGGKGYTKITVKVSAPIELSAETRLFIGTADAPGLLSDYGVDTTSRNVDLQKEVARRTAEVKYSNETSSKKQQVLQKTSTEVADVDKNNKPESSEEVGASEPSVGKVSNVPARIAEDDAEETFFLVLGTLIVLLIVLFFAFKAKEKMNELAGEKFDTSSDEKENKKAKGKDKDNKQGLRKTIKKLDTAYPNSLTMPGKTEYSSATIEEEEEDINVVDLDELYQEKTKTTQADLADDGNNDDLDDFLSSFSFDEEEFEPEEEVPGYDVEFLEKLLASEISFSEDEIKCLNELLNNEIQDDTLKNAEKYLATNPIKTSSKKVLEELVTTYSISQNIIFSSEDIGALNKLINVEIDEDFVTNLKTDPELTKRMYEEIERSKEEYKKPSEIITLNVKDMLPDLSEALRKQGGRKIESEARAETVYFSEGYDVSKLVINDLLPDLSKELNNKESYISKPSAEIQYADNTYEVQTLSIGDALPDLKDAMANPEKYNRTEVEVVVADEDSLLKNIANVQFKPFDDGTRKFEVLNDISVSDIQKEFSQFGNVEISAEEQYITSERNESKDDGFDGLFNNEYVDLDNVQKTVSSEIVVNEAQSETLEELLNESEREEGLATTQEKDVKSLELAEVHDVQTDSQEQLKRKNETSQPETVIKDKSSLDLISKIEEVKTKREDLTENIEGSKQSDEQAQLTPEALNLKYVIDGKTYTVLDKAEFDSNAGCYLAKTDSGYAVLGYVADNLVELKTYETIKNEKISLRLGENLSDGSVRYIIRVGSAKLIVDYKQDCVSYVMDLC